MDANKRKKKKEEQERHSLRKEEHELYVTPREEGDKKDNEEKIGRN